MEKNHLEDRFFRAVLSLRDSEECRRLFNDVCTPKEIQAISQRFAVAEMLYQKRVYSDIVEATGASTATISRVVRSFGEGYAAVFARLAEEKTQEKPSEEGGQKP